MNGVGHSVIVSRLAVGAAQFGLDYGVANTTGRVPAAEVSAIMATASSAGIDTIDTAIAYGDSEAVLGEANLAGWRVISKLPALPDGIRDAESWVHEQVAASLVRLRVKSLDGLLLHRPADLFGATGGELATALKGVKKCGWAAAVGVSVYEPDDLRAIMAVLKPDIIQAPFNVFDRRLVNSGWLTQLASEDIRIHVRSVFLQGLLLMDADIRPAYFGRWRSLLDRWVQWCVEQGQPPAELALAYVLGQPEIERVIVGVDSTAQLEAAIAAAKVERVDPPDSVQSDDRELLNPSLWSVS